MLWILTYPTFIIKCFYKKLLINEQIILLYKELMVLLNANQTNLLFTHMQMSRISSWLAGVITISYVLSCSRYPSRELFTSSCQSDSIILPHSDFQKDIVLEQLSWLHCYREASAKVLPRPALLQQSPKRVSITPAE